MNWTWVSDWIWVMRDLEQISVGVTVHLDIRVMHAGDHFRGFYSVFARQDNRLVYLLAHRHVKTIQIIQTLPM
eukprot:549181-Amorphochlora_amoeboformis.AAC.1